MSRIYVVRHGEASWHAEDYDQLTDKGHAQARSVGAELAARGRHAVPGADIISAGMSSDLEVAVEYGATHLRIGTAVMGSRPTVGYRQSKGGKNNEGEAQ